MRTYLCKPWALWVDYRVRAFTTKETTVCDGRLGAAERGVFVQAIVPKELGAVDEDERSIPAPGSRHLIKAPVRRSHVTKSPSSRQRTNKAI